MSDSWQDVPDDSHNANSEDDDDMEDEYRDANVDFTQGIREMELEGLVDIGALGAWSVSSYKAGSGVKELREDNPHNYWQSDGTQPHHLDIHFSKRVTISKIAIFTDFSLDESYTPSKITFLAGNGFHDLIEVSTIELNQPTGWTHIPFDDKTDGGSDNSHLKTFLIRLLIVANHQHGKDTHLRSVKIYSPMTTYSVDGSILGSFTSRKLLSESVIR